VCVCVCVCVCVRERERERESETPAKNLFVQFWSLFHGWLLSVLFHSMMHADFVVCDIETPSDPEEKVLIIDRRHCSLSNILMTTVDVSSLK